MSPFRTWVLCCGALALLWATGAAAADPPEKGWFGFRVDVSTSGFVLNPTVVAVKVKSVAPNSPAEAQHLAIGDEIVEAEGHPVPGNKARPLRPLLQKAPGESIHLRLKRENGETYSVTLTALKRPS